MQLQKPIRSIQDFLLSTYFADGLRITIGVLLPSLICAEFGLLKYGMTLSLGALCVSIVDTPGPIIHRRNAMLITAGLITLFFILTGFTNRNIYFIGFLLAVASFVFSMFNLYGVRAAAIGTATLLIIVLSIDDIRPWHEVLDSSLLILGGAIWYSALSYLIYRIRPYKVLQRELSDSIHEVSMFLRAKAEFYHENIDYDKRYADLLQLQVSVNEKQDAVREILFKTREIIRDSTPEGRFLLLIFVDMVDLFEQVMSTYYNHKQLHEQFDHLGILPSYEAVIKKTADALDNIAFALKTGSKPNISKDLMTDITNLKLKITDLEKEDDTNHQFNTLGIIALKNIEVNIENIYARIKTISGYFNIRTEKDFHKEDIDVEKFITRQNIDTEIFIENLTFESSTFKHSLRVAIVMLIGFIVAKTLDFSHSYWILLTILVISKPGFSLTKQRNFERLIGTTIGAFVGMGILVYVNDKNTLFVILLICMIGCYSFQRKNYVVSVLFMTPYILILFDFLGMGTLAIARERIYDTFIGSGIAVLASYTLFPFWERDKLKDAMIEMLEANLDYLKQVNKLYFENEYDRTNYKVARKEVYVSNANLASIFQRMFSEPKGKQLFIKEVHQFTSLNHLLSSYIATLSLYNKEHAFNVENLESLKPVANNIDYLLNQALSNLISPKSELEKVPLIRRNAFNDEENISGEALVPEQFHLIQKVAYDIFKITFTIKL